MASLSHGLGLCDRRRADRLRSRRDVFRPSACRRKNGSGNDEPVYAGRLGPWDSGGSHDTVAVDGVLHLLGYRISRMGSRPKHRTESACQTEGITEVHRLQNRLCARRVLAKLVATQTLALDSSRDEKTDKPEQADLNQKADSDRQQLCLAPGLRA